MGAGAKGRGVNLRLDLEILGWLLLGLGLLQGVPLLMAGLGGGAAAAFLLSAAVALLAGLSAMFGARGAPRRLRTRDAFLVVTGGWMLASVFGALPYWFAGQLSLVDAIFESTSGFTTTGATVLGDIEALPASLLLWRSMSQWIGGMGIIVFTIAILPLLGIGGMQLFRAEAPGPMHDKLTPRVADTARRLWLVYVGFTGAAFLALWIAGMSAFDALCHAFTSISTAGFSTRNQSIGAFAPAVQWVVIACMVLGGVSFALHYQWLTGRFRAVLRNSELHAFAILAALFCLAMFWALSAWAVEPRPPLRAAVFQVISLLTTTGYTTADYARWPQFALFLVLPLMALGGMAGSTSGGIKTLRVMLSWHKLRGALARILHPHLVQPVHHAGRPVAEEVVAGIAVFLVAYVLVAFSVALVVGAAGYDVLTALSTGLSMVGNIGPGLGEIGPASHFGHFPAWLKLLLSLAMLAGRLEIFTVLVLFVPAFWRR